MIFQIDILHHDIRYSIRPYQYISPVNVNFE